MPVVFLAALLLSGAAHAAEKPILGDWYEEATYGGYRTISIAHFRADGTFTAEFRKCLQPGELDNTDTGHYTYENGHLRMITEVLLPASIPSIVAGLRVSAGLGWQSLVGAELIVASSGIGYLMVKGQSNVSTAIVMSGMIAIGIVGVVIDVLLRALEARVTPRTGN